MNSSPKHRAAAALADSGVLANFMSRTQRRVLADMLGGEEGEFFVARVLDLVDHISAMPKTYETEKVKTPDKVVHLHYFLGGVDAWIIERDVGDSSKGDGLGPQLQAYGKITLFGGGWDDAEWGYISIQELIENGVELDLYFVPRTVAELSREGKS